MRKFNVGDRVLLIDCSLYGKVLSRKGIIYQVELKNGSKVNTSIDNMKRILNKRQWMLYRYLKRRFKDNIYISKKEICRDLGNYNYNENEKRLCRVIESDVRAINESDEIQKIIVSNHEGYKIGNKEEVEQYLNRRFNRDYENIKLNWKLAKKVSLDKQMRLTFGNERDVIETYPPQEKNEI